MKVTALLAAPTGRAAKRMSETRPENVRPEVREVAPPPPDTGEQAEATPRKKKKKRGGVGAVLDTMEERKRRLEEAKDL